MQARFFLYGNDTFHYFPLFVKINLQSLNISTEGFFSTRIYCSFCNNAIQFPPEIYAKDYLQTQNMVSIFVSDLDFV